MARPPVAPHGPIDRIGGIGEKNQVLALSTACKSPVLKLDLTKSSGQQILWEVLSRPNICGVHLAPPCGTSSRARDIPRAYGPSPLPLRSEAHPDGLPSLKGLDLKRVCSANCLYRLTGEVLRFCIDREIPCSVENPARSHFWATKSFTEPIKDVLSKLEETHFHHCMYGSKGENIPSFFILASTLMLWNDIVMEDTGTCLGGSIKASGPPNQKLPIPMVCVKHMHLVSKITFLEQDMLNHHRPFSVHQCMSTM